MGHRNSLGLAVQPDSGAIWESENGRMAATKSTCCRPARTTAGPSSATGGSIWVRVNVKAWQEGMEDPMVFWVPAIATWA